MCRTVHLAGIRYALSDYCEEVECSDDDLQLEDLLAQFEDPRLDRSHRREPMEEKVEGRSAVNCRR